MPPREPSSCSLAEGEPAAARLHLLDTVYGTATRGLIGEVAVDGTDAVAD